MPEQSEFVLLQVSQKINVAQRYKKNQKKNSVTSVISDGKPLTNLEKKIGKFTVEEREYFWCFSAEFIFFIETFSH